MKGLASPTPSARDEGRQLFLRWSQRVVIGPTGGKLAVAALTSHALPGSSGTSARPSATASAAPTADTPSATGTTYPSTAAATARPAIISRGS
ncbi:MAG TPA: hypothetical protein VNH38_01255 [Candidatus Dormibacteraeota bacterium]|nr:hypothetical protein [Candidatus Dormibacteraeota bacterium]